MRFRRRVTAMVERMEVLREHLPDIVSGEVGINVPYAVYSHDWEKFFGNSDFVDVLDTITLAGRLLLARRDPIAATFRDFVDRAMREEGVSFTLDEKCGVHFYVDEEFEAHRQATVGSLTSARYEAARAAFERGHACLDSPSPDTLGAVRGVFDAIENVFKLSTNGKSARIGLTEITKDLRPLAGALYTGPAENATGLILKSLGEWVNAAHQYRHDPGHPEPAPPPLELAIAMMASGAGFLRWLATIDQKLLGSDHES